MLSLPTLVRVAVALGLSAVAAGADRPNIVLILADDLGYGALGPYGAPPALVRTPHCDRLAAEGLRFTDANTPSSLCSPTRYAVLTGRYTWRTTLTRGVLAESAPLHLEEGRPTLATLVQRLGYATAAIGKWHLGYGAVRADFTGDLKPGPLERGFDFHFGVPTNHGDPIGTYVIGHRVPGLRSTRLDTAAGPSFYGTPKLGLDAPQRDDPSVMPDLAAQAERWIAAQPRDRPFFLYFAPVAIHEPITPSRTHAGRSSAGPMGDWIEELDSSVGRILDALDAAGQTERTIVIFTSDNGGVVNRGSRRLGPIINRALDSGLKLVGDFRGGKRSGYQGGFRVPLLVRWPGRVPAGATTDAPFNLVDLYATLAAMLGDPLPPPAAGVAEDSHDASAVWLGRDGGRRRTDMILHSGDGVFAIRQGRWKYLEAAPADVKKNLPADVKGDDPSPQLYDLDADPAEQHNLHDREPAVVARLAALLQEQRSRAYTRSAP